MSATPQLPTAETVAAARAAQGLPATVSDDAALKAVTAALAGVTGRRRVA